MEAEIKELFASIFMVEKRLTVVCEKLQAEITMKQWLLLALVMHSEEKLNFTELGRLMGCSRQNIKKLASTLEEKGFIMFEEGVNNSQYIHVLDKAYQYGQEMGAKYDQTLAILFQDFSQQEIQSFLKFYQRLTENIEYLEGHVDEMV
ncbi:MarR family winged helix-turn-helix transcriptional regulator [Facklamia lactis]|uniref:MarR family winged helix-turn-helix transcriptional regulator n=1 Tax=Facklamia lactis TaxID=2749967 RepID=UPI0018CFDA60|nr:MarR family transcriptional regulator [Facklamia lactis]MBG9980391.1 MarR family transcriptional regulator [Facklamia lactis]